jgi:hypothetical protein
VGDVVGSQLRHDIVIVASENLEILVVLEVANDVEFGVEVLVFSSGLHNF